MNLKDCVISNKVVYFRWIWSLLVFSKISWTFGWEQSKFVLSTLKWQTRATVRSSHFCFVASFKSWMCLYRNYQN